MPLTTASASTTANTLSTVNLLRISGHSNALSRGFGSASPDVSISMCSGRYLPFISFCIVGTKSSATVQQIQPLANSRMFSSGQVSSEHCLTISPSTPRSPNSFIITANLFDLFLIIKLRINVVLPAPKKPVSIVTGIFSRLLIFNYLIIFWWHSC